MTTITVNVDMTDPNTARILRGLLAVAEGTPAVVDPAEPAPSVLVQDPIPKAKLRSVLRAHDFEVPAK